MQGGYLIYKCRMCGELDKTTHVPDGVITIACLTGGCELPKTWFGIKPHLIDAHACKDGNYGVTDLIGCELDKVG